MSTSPPAPGKSRSRLLSLVAVVALAGAPAAVLRGLCLGNACAEEQSAVSEVPFCSLGAEQRELIAAGFEGELHRSPDLLAVTRPDVVVAGGSGLDADEPLPAWPTTASTAPRVPLIFWGAGIDPTAQIAAGTGLDDVAPTIAELLDFDRPHPGVRSGKAIAGVVAGNPARVVVEVVLKNLGSEDVDDAAAWPNLQRVFDEGAGTFTAVTASLPADPAAILTTIGTGGLPHQHGIVGTLVRNDAGEVVRAWGPRSPVHVIATLPDDLDERLDQEPLIGLVRSDVSDGGLIGGNWYIGNDEDEVISERADPARAVAQLFDQGWGRDTVPDIIGVTLTGAPAFVDAQLGRITRLVENERTEAAVVVTATGGHPDDADANGEAIRNAVERRVPGPTEVVTATTPGGLYLDQEALPESDVTEDDVLEALRAVEGAGGALFADAFPAIAVSFARYC